MTDASHSAPPAAPHTPVHADVVIVGGGFAGASAALALSRRGLTVRMIDLAEPPARAFRAEKFSADQLPLLKAIGVLDALTPHTAVATRAINIRGRRVIDRPPVEDHGLMYADMVKLLRRQPETADAFVHGRACEIRLHGDGGSVLLSDGRRFDGRLVVLATGHARGLRESLGVVRRVVHPTPTINIAFTLRAPPGGFGFPSMAAYGEATGDGVDYTSIFPVGDVMRVNTFVFTTMADPRITAFKQDPMAALLALQPGLNHWLRGAAVIDKAEFFVVELSICDHVQQPGLVLIGDAYRTSCPSVGNGLSCLLVDVACLAELAPRWMATPGMGTDKIAEFYADPVKRRSDVGTHQVAIARRRSVTSGSLSNRFKRALHFGRRQLADRLGRA